MSSKRKRDPNISAGPRKRGRPSKQHQRDTLPEDRRAARDLSPEPESQHPHGEFDPDEFFSIRSIIGEDARRYKVDWEGADPKTGQPYLPTWEPKQNVTKAAVEDWEAEKEARKAAERDTSKKKGIAQLKDTEKRPRGRPRKSTAAVKDKSQSSISPFAPSSGPERPVPAQKNEQQRQAAELEGQEQVQQERGAGAVGQNQAQDCQTIEAETKQVQDAAEDQLPTSIQPSARLPQRKLTEVYVADPPSSFDPADYAAFSSSQIVSGTQPQRETSPAASDSALVDAAAARSLSQKHSEYQPDETSRNEDTTESAVLEETTESIPVNTSSGVHTFAVPAHVDRSVVIPDSQSQSWSSSYVPSTQTKSGDNTEASISEIQAGTHNCDQPVTQPQRESQATTQDAQGTISQPIPDSSLPQDIASDHDAFHHPSTTQAKHQLRLADQVRFETSSQVCDPVEPAAVGEDDLVLRQSPGSELATGSTSSPELRLQSQIQTIASPEPIRNETGRESTAQDTSIAQRSPAPEISTATATSASPVFINSQAQSQQGEHSTQQAAQRVDQPTNSASSQFLHQPQGSSAAPSRDDPFLSWNLAGSPAAQLGYTHTHPLPAFPQQHSQPSPAPSTESLSERLQTQVAFPGAARTLDLTSTKNLISDSVRQIDSASAHQVIQSGQPKPSPSNRYSQQARNRLTVHTAAAERQTSSLQSDSLIAGPPSQFPETFGCSAPLRPVTPSDLAPTPRSSPIMSSPAKDLKTMSSAEAIAHLKRSRAERAAASAAKREEAMKEEDRQIALKAEMRRKKREQKNRDAAGGVLSAIPPRLASPAVDREVRSPSMIPPAEEIPEVTQEENNRSERYETLLTDDEPEAQLGNSVNVVTQSEGEHHSVTPPSNEHALAIPFIAHQKDHIKQAILRQKSLIDDVNSKVWPIDHPIYADAQKLVDKLRKLTLHPDLVDAEALAQLSDNTQLTKQWAESCSSKFRFLGSLLEELRNHKLQITILVQPGYLLDIMETYLRGSEISYEFYGNSNPSIQYRNHEALRITIVPTNAPLADVSTTAEDLIVGFDNTAETSAYLRDLRQRAASFVDSPPYVSLILPYSVEHIEQFMPNYESEAVGLHVLVKTVTAYRSDMGQRVERSPNQKSEDIPSLLAQWIIHGGKAADWPFNPAPAVHLADPVGNSQALYEENGEGNTTFARGKKRVPDAHHHAEFSPSPKRSRIKSPLHMDNGLSMTINPQDKETTHVSDSVDDPSQRGGTVSDAQRIAEIQALKEEFERKMQEMEDALRAERESLQQHKAALEDLQYRHEEQRREMVQAQAERDSLLQAAAAASARKVTLETTVSDLRIENRALKDHLTEAREALLSHEIPDRAELEIAKLAAVKAEADKAKLETRVKTMDSELDYLRARYQDASNSASSLGTTNEELNKRISVLEKKASGEMARARSVTLNKQTQRLEQDHTRLKQMLKDRDALLQRKEDEINKLKESSRGRMGTRGSSVPRSPRVGSPMRLDVGGRAGSRQVSPAPGHLGARSPHPLSKQG